MSKPMDRYKFRGKRIDNLEWMASNVFIFCDSGVQLWNETSKWVYIESGTVGQYTGLKDKNGKEIYEGDIVGFMDAEDCSTESGRDFEEFYNHGYVDYDVESLRFYFTNRNSVEMDDILSEDIEVIGNRWDNPSPLKGG